MTEPERNRAVTQEFQRQLVDVLWSSPFYAGLATMSWWMEYEGFFFFHPSFLCFLAVAALAGLGQRETLRRLQLPPEIPGSRNLLSPRHHAILFAILALVLFSAYFVMAVREAVIDQESFHFPVIASAVMSLILAAAYRIVFYHFRPVRAAVSHSSETAQAIPHRPVR